MDMSFMSKFIGRRGATRGSMLNFISANNVDGRSRA